MYKKSKLLIIILALSFSLFPIKNVYSGGGGNLNLVTSAFSTDSSNDLGDPIFAFFDLRNRESFVQVTNVNNEDENLHIQIFNVDQDCNENNFFDLYTPNDTHVYNLREILTNDGNPSGVVLPDNAYGFVSIISANEGGDVIGNFRIIDDNGFEYRTNMQFRRGGLSANTGMGTPTHGNYHFNFNETAGITFSDIVGITYSFGDEGEIVAADPTEDFQLLDIDIINNNEVVFSCRNVIFSCVDEDNPRLEELLEFVADNTQGSASVASFEYGINNAISHSKDGELLCPGNNIAEGIVNLNQITLNGSSFGTNFLAYVGLNNGNGRGSMDSIFVDNFCVFFPQSSLCNNP